MSEQESLPLNGSPIKTYFHYAIPSLLGLLAISTTSVIDGLFVGLFLGAEALAAVNLLIPYFTLMFAIALMVAIGGSVLAGKYIGQNKPKAASAAFSQSLLTIIGFTLIVASTCWYFDRWLFQLLGAPETLFSLMQQYFQVIAFGMVVQLANLVMYYFVRVDGYPQFGTQALMVGAVTNIILDAVFIGYLQLGIAYAAWATVIAQVVQCLFLLRFFTFRKRQLTFTLHGISLSTLLRSLYNGCSEFINEISVGVVIFSIHWLLLNNGNEQGVAGFAIANYLLFIGMMVYYGFIDPLHVLISQNLGAGNTKRIQAFVKIAALTLGGVSLLLAMIALFANQLIAGIFLEDPTSAAALQAKQFMTYIWPCFLFSGFNVLLSAYFTALHQPLPSACISLSRGLVLPVIFLMCFALYIPQWHFLYALPLAEALTLSLALILYLRHKKGFSSSTTKQASSLLT
ncbi:multidrug transporter MatE [Photobacterium sanctipauli]|uniref:Multidrug resistance protein NorM n=1 Tax=Photobacterium sanctipauli TaxID=1342794 RepID=A0A2T3NB14_9GAMM|nr:MATE family efflux transporter [Photobacterium sanctipauli]PSW11053.1 multidrug transporter MatE [Photobacterium sanctipauli]